MAGCLPPTCTLYNACCCPCVTVLVATRQCLVCCAACVPCCGWCCGGLADTIVPNPTALYMGRSSSDAPLPPANATILRETDQPRVPTKFFVL